MSGRSHSAHAQSKIILNIRDMLFLSVSLTDVQISLQVQQWNKHTHRNARREVDNFQWK